MRAPTPIVIAEGLGKSFDQEPVVKAVDLQIERGTIVGLIGPSGCGKTTTVRLLTGLLEPTTGRCALFGTPSLHLSAQQRQRIGYMPQIPALFPDLSQWENLSYHASMYGLRLRRRVRLRHVLDWVELTDDRRKKVREVSGGMQRRLALAAAFVHDPELVFLDEPTAGIDPILRAKFWEQFREMRDEGRTMCVTTQYVGEAAYCDYVGLLSDGELLMLDTPENLRRAAFGGDVVEIELSRAMGDDEVAALGAVPGVAGRIEQLTPQTWRIVVSDTEAPTTVIADALARLGLPVIEVNERVVDFDDAFVRLIERHRTQLPAPVAAETGAEA